MKSITHLKSFKISKENAKKVLGGTVPGFAEQRCWEAQNYLNNHDLERCSGMCEDPIANNYLNWEYEYC